MEKTDIIEKLMQFNISRQEAQLYICLLEHGKITGYEASKYTGISRSNAYGALSSLADKGAAVVTEGNSTLYSAVNPEEFLNNKLRRLEESKKYILENLPKTEKETEGYITIQGYQNIRDKITHMIEKCEMRLYLAAESKLVESFGDSLKKAKEKGLKIVIISDKDFSHLATTVYLDHISSGQIRLITDSSYVLTGELTDRNSDSCLYSGQENLVIIMKEALRNKIRLLEIEGMEKGEKNND